MNEREMHDLMTYIFADHDAEIKPEKRKVWLDQFGHLSFEEGMLAARVLIGRKSYGVPKVHDFATVIEEITKNHESWGEAYDKWVSLAKRFGYYRAQECFEAYENASPIGAKALGTSAKEWFSLKTEDNGIFKAQFRQRYEILSERAKNDRMISPKVKALIDSALGNNKLIS